MAIQEDDMTETPKVVMWLDGIFGPVPAYVAWCEWFALQDSPIPESRERAAAIRVSLKEIGYSQ